MNVPAYKRLPGRGRTWSGTSRLYLGEDHIMAVQSVGYSESYKRFFFADIQAFVVRKTAIGQIWNGVWGLIAIFFALIAIAVDDTIGSSILGGIAGFFAICVLINTAMGPMCTCHVKTAVQTERLIGTNRMRTAKKLLDRVRPLIAAAQGEMPREQLALVFDRTQGLAPATIDSAPPVAG
ncbi:MAG TPA: hypothetical protein VK530_07275 [Candidatus Acidoferrum sp.]|nr:hypothetical protein [Candidatus Acidoferrum sp.]